MKIQDKLIQELIAKTALYAGLSVKQLQHPEKYHYEQWQIELYRKIRTCLVYFLYENGITQNKIKILMNLNKKTRIEYQFERFNKMIKYDPDYRFWYSQIKRNYIKVLAREYKEAVTADSFYENLNLFENKNPSYEGSEFIR